ncbi:hypothetical protein [Hymenobacter jejuensis]|uniref:Uncharacterized protein n=1 Tax=Hymenobacter jejuensis TaxID=2502781 RepID=A0A5B8A2D8_9BACT|nr:hypothetical protein [Hymenobacter jejuensis]QDA60836.1 hypothetical protein FHG12_12300 [Hymenobacter jejuensis]
MNFLDSAFRNPTKKTVILMAAVWLLGVGLLGFATEGFSQSNVGIYFMIFFGLTAVVRTFGRYQKAKQ